MIQCCFALWTYISPVLGGFQGCHRKANVLLGAVPALCKEHPHCIHIAGPPVYPGVLESLSLSAMQSPPHDVTFHRSGLLDWRSPHFSRGLGTP